MDNHKNLSKTDDLDEIRMLLGEETEDAASDRLSLDDILAALDGCHMDVENHRLLGKAIGQKIKEIL